MRIAVPSYSPGGLEAEVCPHLGHAEFVTVVEVEGSRPVKVEVVDCRGQHYGFARRPVEVLTSLSVDAVAVKGLGARALDWLRQSGVKVYKVNAIRVADAVAEVAEGRASEVSVEEAYRSLAPYTKSALNTALLLSVEGGLRLYASSYIAQRGGARLKYYALYVIEAPSLVAAPPRPWPSSPSRPG